MFTSLALQWGEQVKRLPSPDGIQCLTAQAIEGDPFWPGWPWWLKVW